MLTKKVHLMLILFALVGVIAIQFWLLTSYDIQPGIDREKPTSVTPNNINGAIPLNQLHAENPEATIFFADNYDHILMYGNPQFWDDEKNMSLDLNGDGIFEDFSISRDRSKGILLQARTKLGDAWKTMDFWSYNMYELVWETSAQDYSQNRPMVKTEYFISDDPSVLITNLIEGNNISKCSGMLDDRYIQISCCDIDKDGIGEVIVSVGNKSNENITAIYEYDEDGEIPFNYCGYIKCGTMISYRGNNILWTFREKPIEHQYDVYVYENKR